MAVKYIKSGGSTVTQNLDFESGNITDYLDTYESQYSLSTAESYDGVYSLFMSISGSVSSNRQARRDFDSPIKATEVNVKVYLNFSSTARNDDYTFVFRDADDNVISTVDFRREYIVNRNTWLNGTLNCGQVPEFTWLECRWTNINYDSQTFDFEIYNLDSGITFFSISSVPFVSVASNVSYFVLSAASYSGISYSYYIDSIEFKSQGTWKRQRR